MGDLTPYRIWTATTRRSGGCRMWWVRSPYA